MATTTALEAAPPSDSHLERRIVQPAEKPAADVEKREVQHSGSSTSLEEQRGEKFHEEDYTPNVTDPFPVDPDAPEETHQLTLRALIVGCVLGSVVGASNIYLGLKTGFTFGPQLFGAIFGYAILKPISKALPESGLLGRLFGGHFGPKENCTVQTAATAAGGLGILFVSAVPAMYRLELLSFLPRDDVGRLIALTTASGFFGIFFVIPLRKYFIIRQKLVFPTPTATAFTIRSLHNVRTGAAHATKKSLALLYSLIATFVYKVVAGFAPGMLYDWHIGWTLSRIGWPGMIQMENFGWYIEFTPAFFGAGQLSGLNASWSFFGGSVLAWAIIAPSLIQTGEAVGIQPDDENFPEVWSYLGLRFSDLDAYVNNPSPRYWLLWPGVLVMLVYSFVELFVNVAPIFRGMYREGDLNPKKWFAKGDPSAGDIDPTPIAHRVPAVWWVPGLVASIIVSCALLATQFSMNVGEAFLALLLGFLFSFIGVQSSAATDINPVSTIAKASQLVFGGVSKGTGDSLKDAQTLNLIGGTIAAGSAAQATDMTGDLKTGWLLGAKPRVQFIAQLVGSCTAIFLNVGLYILFTTASPCIMYLPESGICTYGAPSVSAWAAVATAVTHPTLPVPRSSGFTAIGLSIAAVISVLVKYYLLPEKYWHWVPNWNAVGLGFVVPQVYYSFAMVVGAMFNWIWLKRNPKGFDMYMFPISAGLLAGEGLGGVFNALLAVAGADGARYGTAIGCPMYQYCG